LPLRLQREAPPADGGDLPGDLAERAVLFQPRAEEAVELLVGHGGGEVDAVDVLRREEAELHEERGGEIRGLFGVRALRKKVLAILGEGEIRRKMEPRSEKDEDVAARRRARASLARRHARH